MPACVRAEMFASLVTVVLLVSGASAAESQCGYHGFCHTEAKGFLTKSALRLPDVEIPPETEEFEFTIPDKCKEWGRELAGSVIHVCDSDVTPTLQLSSHGVGVARVFRHGDKSNPANIYMKQYCI